MNKVLVRLFYGLLFAVPLMIVSYALASAGDQTQEAQPAALNCRACHEPFQEAWESGAHGKAMSSSTFTAMWEEQGKPGSCLSCHVTGYDSETNTWASDGITCQACHDTAASNHPMEPMAADRSSKMCGECHAETYFEWQVSSHRESGLDCVGCHDPHATGLKAEDAGTQCASCHRQRASNFAHSQHSTQGLTCADCHLTELTSDAIEGHARLDHSFNVRLSTCNSCHSYQMHDPVQVHPENPTPAAPEPLGSVEQLSLVADPTPAGPSGYALLGGLIGLAAGVILGPWLERWHHHEKNGDK